MYSASMSIVLDCLLLTSLGPDHPWCTSGNALTYHCAHDMCLHFGGTPFSVSFEDVNNEIHAW